MISTSVLIVRIYLHESQSIMKELLEFLHDESKTQIIFLVSSEY